MTSFKSCLFVLLAAAVPLAAFGAAARRDAGEKTRISAFYPTPREYCGLFVPGETPGQILHVVNHTDKNVSITEKRSRRCRNRMS